MIEWFYSYFVTPIAPKFYAGIYGILSYLGWYHKTAKILFLGLDNAGKTTLLRRMKDDIVGIYEPTFHPNYETLVVGNVQFHTYDLGGHKSSRQIWHNYWEDIDGIVFLVDAVDSQRFDEAKKELDIILSEKKLDETPILVLGNKIDLSKAVSEKVLRNQLSFLQKNNTKLFMCSIVSNIGFKKGFIWLGKIV